MYSKTARHQKSRRKGSKKGARWEGVHGDPKSGLVGARTEFRGATEGGGGLREGGLGGNPM